MTHFDYVSNFVSNPSICNLIKLISADTWERIGFVYGRPFNRINEVTITENIVYIVNRYVLNYGVSKIVLQEASDEKTNGNDLLLYIQIGNNLYYPLAIQAKKVNNKEIYRAFGGKLSQLNSLITYARSIGGIPLYLLYNYVNRSNNNFNTCNIAHDWNQFGCSLVSAFYIESNFVGQYKNGTYKMTLPQFNDFHPNIALPLFILVCCANATNNINNLASLFKGMQQQTFNGVTLNELMAQDEWIGIGNDLGKKSDNGNIKLFLPRYRIIISSNNQ